MKRIMCSLIFFTLPLCASEEVAEADKTIGLTGNWDCFRNRLVCHGVTFTGSYTNDALGNPVGGKSKGFTAPGSLGLEVEIDFGKSTFLKGLHFFNSWVWRTGKSLSQENIGNQFPVQQNFGSQTYRLNELYLKEILFDGKLTLKAGRLDGGNDFLQSPLYYHYVGNAFDGNPISVFFNTPFTAYPNATWGAYIDFKPTEKLLVKAAAYNGNTKSLANNCHGMNFTFKDPNGVMLMTEWSYMPNFLDLPGHYRAGYYYITEGTATPSNYGFYFLVDQTVYRPECARKDGGLTPFAALLFAPNKSPNLFPFFFTTGAVYQGVPGRPDDSISIGMSYGHYIKKPQTFEAGLELNYWWQANPWLAITPDIQYIINPKGLDNIDNALVIGFQLSVTL